MARFDLRAFVAICSGTGLALAGCSWGPCDVELVASRAYRAVGSGDPKASVAFVHDGVAGKELVVDRAAGTVRIAYRRDGREVIETWSITKVGATD